jgi:hypothetical protein
MPSPFIYSVSSFPLPASEAEVATGKLKRHKTPGVDLTPAELIQAGGETLHSEIHKIVTYPHEG